MTTENEVYTYILAEASQEAIERFQHAMRERQRMLSHIRSADICPGVTVITCGSLRPKYMLGLTGQVCKVNQTTAVVKFNEAFPGKFSRSWSNELRVPMSCLRVV